MSIRRCLFSFAIFLAVAQPALAAANPWFGTWKLNHSKSNMTGDTFTIAKTGDKYRMDFGAVKFEFKEDGQDYPTVPTRTVSLKKVSDNEWLQVLKTNGRENSRSTMKVSSDGKTLTSHTTGTHADGSTYSRDTTDTRIGAGSGLAGTWKKTKESSSEPETLIYSDAGGGSMKMESTEDKSIMVTKFDGQPSKNTGPNAVPNQTLAIKASSPTSYTWTVFMDGKPYVKGINTLSPDGKSFKELNWLVTKPAEKYTLIYEKQ